MPDFDYWEQLPSFCGPRISPGLRFQRVVAERNRLEECLRRMEMWVWTSKWREAREAAGGNPQPTDPAVQARAVVDQFIDDQRASGQCTLRREDEKWL
jgi:hypothetical protein